MLRLSQHPQIILQIEVMKTEVITYQTLTDFIKPLVERKDDKGKDTFDMSDWWKANCAKLPAFTYALRAVLTNSPNSGPPERLYSIFNSNFDGFAVNNIFTVAFCSKCNRVLRSHFAVNGIALMAKP